MIGPTNRRRVPQTTGGICDEAVLAALRDAGYRADTVTLLDLAPLIQLAWADGQVSPVERLFIIELALRRQVLGSSALYKQLSAWLERRPPAEFFRNSLRGIRARLEGLPRFRRRVAQRRLLAECAAVLRASRFAAATDCALPDESREALKQIATAIAIEEPPEMVM